MARVKLRCKSSYREKGLFKKGKNLNNGAIIRCSIGKSINIQAQNYSDHQGQNNTYYNEIVVYQTDFDQHSSSFLSLVDESRNAGVLDSGASKTVCRESWLSTFLDSLNNDEKEQILLTKSISQYRLGDGAKITARTAGSIPIVIGTMKAKTKVNIVPSNIQLTSRDAMKRTTCN